VAFCKTALLRRCLFYFFRMFELIAFFCSIIYGTDESELILQSHLHFMYLNKTYRSLVWFNYHKINNWEDDMLYEWSYQKMLRLIDKNLTITEFSYEIFHKEKTLIINAILSPDSRACKSCGSTVIDGNGKSIVVKMGRRKSLSILNNTIIC